MEPSDGWKTVETRGAITDPIRRTDFTAVALYATVLESLPDPVIVTDFTGRILYLNLAAIRLIGMNRGSVRGRLLSDVITVLDGVTRKPVSDPLTRFIARNSRLRPSEFDLLKQWTGTEIPVEDSCSVLRGPNSESEGVVLVLRDATGRRELALNATHDSLTRLTNRDEFERQLQLLLDTLRPGDAHALLYMDLDHFKLVNDTHGHAAGDSVLRRVAEIFRASVRDRDTLARLGGDKFALLLEHCPIDLAYVHAHTLAQSLAEQEFLWSDTGFRLGVSIGVVAIVTGDQDPESVLAAADRACYTAKRHSSKQR